MERLLEREERTTLLELLGVNPQTFRNVPLMKQAFKRACRKHHPDKGGGPEKMVLLNSLWQKYQEAVLDMRSTPEVFSESYGSSYFRNRYAAWASGVFTHGGPDPEPDLYCNESSDSELETDASPPSSPEPESSGYNSFPRDGRFSTSTPTSQEAPSAFREPEQPKTQPSTPSSSSGRSGPSPEEPAPKRRRPAEPMDGAGPSSQASFASTPPKEKAKVPDGPTDLPSCLFDFISHAVFSNKTVNGFIIYTTIEKASLLYDKIDKFKTEFKSVHKYEQESAGIGGAFLFLLTSSKHRLSAIKNFCNTFCTVSFLIVKMVLKPLELYRFICKSPFVEIKSSKSLFSTDFDDEGKEQACNWNSVAEFAVEYELDDPLIILAHYLDFAATPPCPKCDKPKTKAHLAHKTHHLNAVLFEASKSQRSICNQAADIVMAKKRLELQESTRVELLAKCFKKQLDKLKELDEIDIHHHMAGVAWYSCLFEDFDKKLYKILRLFTDNVAKQRNVLFRGPVNTGKTTCAAAIMDLVGGKSLNVNCPQDKLNFELGVAIDKFAVVFEDVKGPKSFNKKLQPGQGINNLDNLREYLDGAVPVNLERKHMNKRSQIFPPCIATMNEYLMPETVFIRFYYKLDFIAKPFLQRSLEKCPSLGRQRILQSGLTLFMLLMWYLPRSMFNPSLQEDIGTWKEIVEKTVSHAVFCHMLENVEAGDSPLLGILEEEDEEEDI
nr:large T antigen [Bat polyomavirus]